VDFFSLNAKQVQGAGRRSASDYTGITLKKAAVFENEVTFRSCLRWLKLYVLPLLPACGRALLSPTNPLLHPLQRVDLAQVWTEVLQSR